MSIVKFLVGVARAIVFVTEHHYATTGSAQSVSYTGAIAGDLAIIVDWAQPVTPAGFSLAGSLGWQSGTINVYSRVLTSADIVAGSVSYGSTGNGGVIGIYMYRGATTATLKASTLGSATTLSIPGFTKAALSKAVCTLAFNAGTAGTPTAPAGATQRANFTDGGVLKTAFADYLPASSYTNSATSDWTGMTAGSNFSGGMLVELT